MYLSTMYVNINGTLHEVDNEDGWPRTSERCPIDGARILYTVHGDMFFCDSEGITGPDGDEHVFYTTFR